MGKSKTLNRILKHFGISDTFSVADQLSFAGGLMTIALMALSLVFFIRDMIIVAEQSFIAGVALLIAIVIYDILKTHV